jgi:hypothetical protein
MGFRSVHSVSYRRCGSEQVQKEHLGAILWCRRYGFVISSKSIRKKHDQKRMAADHHGERDDSHERSAVHHFHAPLFL